MSPPSYVDLLLKPATPDLVCFEQHVIDRHAELSTGYPVRETWLQSSVRLHMERGKAEKGTEDRAHKKSKKSIPSVQCKRGRKDGWAQGIA